MKAALLSGKRQFKISQIADPEILKDTDVLIRIKMVGVCGSDIHYYKTSRIGSQIIKAPFILGHEAAGIIEKTGNRVTRVKVGQKIAIDPAVSCGKCDQCRSGRENTCRNLTFMGNPGERQGALCEQVIHSEKSCYPVDQNTSFEQAVMTEPLAIAVYAVRQSRLPPGANVAIMGAGPIGLCVFKVLQTKNIGHIYITDKISDRLDFSGQLNPHWYGNPENSDILKKIIHREPLSLDVVFECSGDPDVYKMAIELLKPGGILAIIGIPETDYITFPIHILRRKEITILNIRRQAATTQKAIDLLETGKINIDPMVTHHFTLEQTQAAFDMVANYRDGVIKAMICLD